MVFKRKNYDIEINFDANVDLSFWALPVSICFLRMQIGSGGRVFHTLIRILCFQLSWEIWRWNWTDEVTDIDNSVEDLFNGQC